MYSYLMTIWGSTDLWYTKVGHPTVGTEFIFYGLTFLVMSQPHRNTSTVIPKLPGLCYTQKPCYNESCYKEVEV